MHDTLRRTADLPSVERDRLRRADDLSPVERAMHVGVPASAVPAYQIRAEDLVKVDPFAAARVRVGDPDPRAVRLGPPPHGVAIRSTVAGGVRPGADPRTLRLPDPADATA